MKLITGSDFKDWDQFTIKNEPITSIKLMERAADAFVDSFISYTSLKAKFVDIICGKGNNGGDGLAIARMLRDDFLEVRVHILDFMEESSKDFKTNLARLQKLGDVPIQFYTDTMPEIHRKSMIIDAILGTGVNKPVNGMLATWIDHINGLPNKVVSVDVPSGLPTDDVCLGTAIKCDLVITFQLPKLSFFLKENARFFDAWDVADIGLTKGFISSVATNYNLIDRQMLKKIYKRRHKNTHKGDYGHALIVAGSEGKIGAAILSTLGCLRSGAGLVTTCVPECGREIIHETIPEAMVLSKGFTCLNGTINDINNYTIGIGPGIGTDEKTIFSLKSLLNSVEKPLVIDADGLNILALNPALSEQLPKGSILTPHYKEFQRLFGTVDSEKDMIDRAVEISVNKGWIIVLKGAFSRIILPNGKQYINTTGNPGMATAGSGDVLTGIITGLLAQGMKPHHAAIYGVYVHGLAGDLALNEQSVESLIAGDIIRHLGKAFNKIKK